MDTRHIPTMIEGKGPTRPAYTLVELVAVIAILGIVSTFVGGPTLSNLRSLRSSAAAARIVSDIRYAQRLALSSGQRTWIVFNAGSNQYALYVEDADNPGKANRITLPNPLDRSTAPVQLNEGAFASITLDSVNIAGGSELEFDSFGTPYASTGSALASTSSVVLAGGMQVVVYPVSGLAEQIAGP